MTTFLSPSVFIRIIRVFRKETESTKRNLPRSTHARFRLNGVPKSHFSFADIYRKVVDEALSKVLEEG